MPETVQLTSRVCIDPVVSMIMITLSGCGTPPRALEVAVAVSVTEVQPNILAKYNGTATCSFTWIAFGLVPVHGMFSSVESVFRQNSFGYPLTIVTLGRSVVAFRFPVTAL